MSAAVIIACVLLAGIAIAYTLWVRDKDIPPPPAEDPELRHLEARRQVLYENLKDLQFEYHQGKLSEEDYQSLKQGFLYDLAGVMDSIERRNLATGRPASQAQKRAGQLGKTADTKPRHQSEGAETTCPACGKANPPANRFCGSCGAPLSNKVEK
jgi:hypothetical protein